MRMRMLLCLGLGLLAWAGQAETAYGLLWGRALYEDGAPCPAYPLTVHMANLNLSISTRPDGSFSCIALAGTVDITAGTVHTTAEVLAGEVSKIALRVPLSGVVLVTDLPRKTKIEHAEILSLVWKSADGVAHPLAPPAKPGTQRLGAVPPEVHDLVATVWWVRDNTGALFTYHWTMPGNAVLRRLQLMLGTISGASLVVHEAQLPANQARIIAHLNWEQPAGDLPASVSCEISGLRTGADGKVALLLPWQPVAYTATLTVNGIAGPSVHTTFGNARLTPDVYTMPAAK